jgi:hypothetical protein
MFNEHVQISRQGSTRVSFQSCSRRITLLGAIAFLAATAGFAQPPQQPLPETPRQALLEMISRGGPAIAEHLTVESRASLKETGDYNDLAKLNIAFLWQAFRLQTFETGPVLASYEDPRDNKKFEVRIDGDDLNGEEDSIVPLKRQGQTWRLNKITMVLDMPVGDPVFLQSLLGKNGEQRKGEGRPPQAAETSVEVVTRQASDPRPEFWLGRIVSAEQDFARMRPEIGFTCSLPDLVASSGAFGESLDLRIATDNIGGYRFLLVGCSGKPSGSFQAIAEPLEGSGHLALCIDATWNLRFAEDGLGATCLTAGKFGPPSSL